MSPCCSSAVLVLLGTPRSLWSSYLADGTRGASPKYAWHAQQNAQGGPWGTCARASYCTSRRAFPACMAFARTPVHPRTVGHIGSATSKQMSARQDTETPTFCRHLRGSTRPDNMYIWAFVARIARKGGEKGLKSWCKITRKWECVLLCAICPAGRCWPPYILQAVVVLHDRYCLVLRIHERFFAL